MAPEILQVIEENHLFAGLNGELLRDIAASATRKTLGPNEILFRKGDRADEIWGVLSGRVVLQVTTGDGKELVLRAFEAGDVFGEVGVLDFGPRLVDAMAETRSELFRLGRRQFLKHLQSSPELCFRVFSLLCNDLRETTEALECAALYALPGRLAKKLIELAGTNDNESGKARLIVGVSHNELARYLGVHRVSVSRQMSQWEKAGILVSGRQRIEIRNPQDLLKLSAPIQSNESNHDNWGAYDFSRQPLREPQNDNLLPDTGATPVLGYRGILAVNAAEYSQSLATDAAGTLKRLKAGMRAISRAIEDGDGRLISHSGDRVLAAFHSANDAYEAALAIHERVDGLSILGSGHTHSLFRIGVHYGELLDADAGYFGETTNIAIHLTDLSGARGICVSGLARRQLDKSGGRDFQFLGKHELKNVSGSIDIYMVGQVSLARKLLLRAESLIPRQRRKTVTRWAAIIALLAIGLAGAHFGSRLDSDPSLSSRSIAVLPFELVGDADYSYLSNGLASEIRAGLETLPDILVIGKTSVEYFTAHESPPAEISEGLQADWILQGSVGRNGDELIASARLFNAASGVEVWNHEFSGNWSDFGNFPAVIVGLAGDSLSVGTNGDSDIVLVSRTDNAEARTLYMRAEELLSKGICADAASAVPLLERSVELDPEFAEAWARLANIYNDVHCPLSKKYLLSRRELAENALTRALILAPDSAVVLALAAGQSMAAGDLQVARQFVEKALALNANNVDALYQLTLIYLQQDNWVAAIDVIERVLHLDPLNFRNLSYYSYYLTTSGRWEELLALGQKTLVYFPDNVVPYYWMSNAHLHLGNRLAAIDLQRKAMPFGAPIDLWTGLDYQWNTPIRRAVRFANLRAYLGQFDEARRLIKDEYTFADDDASPENSVGYLINMGEIESIAGNFDTSIRFFEQAIERIPGKEYDLESTNRGPWISAGRQTRVSLALLHAYRQVGNNVRAILIAEIFEQDLDKQRQLFRSVGAKAEHLFLYAEAQFHAIEGRKSVALATLRDWRENDKAIFNYLKIDPFLQSLRHESMFQVIVAEIESELADVRAQYYASYSAHTP